MMSGLADELSPSPEMSTCVDAVASGKGYLPCISLTKYLRKGMRKRMPMTPPKSDARNTSRKLTLIWASGNFESRM